MTIEMAHRDRKPPSSGAIVQDCSSRNNRLSRLVILSASLMAILSACTVQRNVTYESDKAACTQRGYSAGSAEYKACLEQFEALHEERSNRWRVEQSN